MGQRQGNTGLTRRGFFGTCTAAILAPAVAPALESGRSVESLCSQLRDDDPQRWAQLWDAVDDWPNGAGPPEYDRWDPLLLINFPGAQA